MSAQSLKIRMPEDLPKPERDVLAQIALGLPCKAMNIRGPRNKLTSHGIEWHRAKLQNRANLHSIAELTKLAIRIGLAEIDV